MRKTSLILILLAALVAAYIGWPRSMAGLVDTSAPLEVTLSSGEMPWEPGMLPLVVEPGTAEMEAIRQVLYRHRYGICWKSLPILQSFMDPRINEGGLTVTLKSADGRGFHFGDESSQFCLFPSARIGFLYSREAEPGAALCRELTAALGPAQ